MTTKCIILLVLFYVVVDANIFHKPFALIKESYHNIKDGFHLISKSSKEWVQYVKNSTHRLKHTYKRKNFTNYGREDREELKNTKVFNSRKVPNVRGVQNNRELPSFRVVQNITEVPNVKEVPVIREIQNHKEVNDSRKLQNNIKVQIVTEVVPNKTDIPAIKSETPIVDGITEYNENSIREEIKVLQQELQNMTWIRKGIQHEINDLITVLHELKLNRTNNQIQ